MDAQWHPDESILSDIVQLLRDADSTDSAVQRRLAEALLQLSALTDAPCYYCFILTNCAVENVEIRQRAGLLLKKHIGELPAITTPTSNSTVGAPGSPSSSGGPPPVFIYFPYVMSSLFRALQDPEEVVRKTSGTVIASALTKWGVKPFATDIFPFLNQLLNHANLVVVESACETLSKVLDDDTTFATVPLCRDSLPRLLQLAEFEKTTSVSSKALECLNLLERNRAFSPGQPFEEFFPAYWRLLGILATSQPHARTAVLQGMCHVVLLTPEILQTNLTSILNFVLSSLDPTTQPYEARREALDILTVIIKKKEAAPALRNCLPHLVPLLVENAVYSEWDLLQMDQAQFEDDNAAVADTAEDIDPQQYFGSRGGALRGQGGTAGGSGADIRSSRTTGSADADEDEEDEGDEDGLSSESFHATTTWGSNWTVRKRAALLIDHLTVAFRREILQCILPIVEQRLQSPQWEIRESAVLILGAIAHGCLAELDFCLPGVLKLLLGLCEDPKPIIRSISVWTMSRFSTWIAPQPEALSLVVTAILKRILDTNKHVQEAACAAFAPLEQEARSALLPHLDEIITTLSKAMVRFQKKNLSVLLDVIGTLAESVGASIDTLKFHQNLLQPLISIWIETDLTDPSLIIEFECLTCTLMSAPQGTSIYCGQIMTRCYDLLNQVLQRIESEVEIEKLESTNQQLQFFISELFEVKIVDCTLDLFSACCETHPEQAVQFIRKTPFPPLLVRCCDIPTMGSVVKQAAFALIGDLAQRAPNEIAPHVCRFVEQLTPYAFRGTMAVCQNSSWALGQIALHCAATEELQPLMRNAAAELTKMLGTPGLLGEPSHIALICNACLTLGRLAIKYSASVAQSFHDYLGPWCVFIEKTSFDKEKIHAFNGFCNVVPFNEQAVIANLPLVLNAIASLYLVAQNPIRKPEDHIINEETSPTSAPSPPPVLMEVDRCRVPNELHEKLHHIVTQIRVGCPIDWEKAISPSSPSSVKPNTIKVIKACF